MPKDGAVISTLPVIGSGRPESAADSGRYGVPGWLVGVGHRNVVIHAGACLTTVFDGGCGLTADAVADRLGNVSFTDLMPTDRCRDRQGHAEAGVIFRYNTADGRTTVFRSPSGQANGLDPDVDGSLVVPESADHRGRRVTQTDMRTGKSVMLAGQYEGRPLNSPNGVSVDQRGRIYFTDPRYEGSEPVDQPVEGVYRIGPDGSIHRIIVNATKPDGALVTCSTLISKETRS